MRLRLKGEYMPPFEPADVAGKPFLLPMLRRAYQEVEMTLRALDDDGGQRLDYLLQDAAKGMRRQAADLAKLCNTEDAAVRARAEQALYEVGLISAGISPVTVPTPPRYAN
jgi:hypothetical protein